jgi:hypothetical protein
MNIFNNFTSNTNVIAAMVINTGKGINDLGLFFSCRDNPLTRYVVFSVNGLPAGIFLGICGPVECKEEDYNLINPYIATFANQIVKALDIKQAFFEKELTEDNFHFYDSQKQNEKVQTMGAGHYIALLFALFLILSVIIGTIIEIMEISKKTAREKLGIYEPEQRKSS